MPLLTWNDSLSVGVGSIDSQHAVLVGILNDLYDAMMKGHARDVTGPLLRKLINYTRDHFAAEEAMMASAKYTGLAGHRYEHQVLTKQVSDYAARFERGEYTVNIDLLKFLRNWLTNHIQHSDKKYGPCLIQHGTH
ncbi:MAG TPA: bacteriohemerythrin [Terracidiphilus sp.]|nr:bacteriohemerythrin [Terracidiphilus sp.]